jgi:hypothetical protein
VKGERPALSISASSIQASIWRVEGVKGEKCIDHICYLLSAICYLLSAICYRLLAIGYWLLAIGYSLRLRDRLSADAIGASSEECDGVSGLIGNGNVVETKAAG